MNPYLSVTNITSLIISCLAAGAANRLNVFLAGLGYAVLDPVIMDALRSRLVVAERRHVDTLLSEWADGSLNLTPDAVALLLIHARQLEMLPRVSRRRASPATLHINVLRGGRPRNDIVSSGTPHLYKPFDERAFHFDRPAVRHEVIGEITVNEVKFTLILNKYPLFATHVLAVPEIEAHHPQHLDCRLFEALTGLAESCADHGMLVGYSSRYAGATVNQAHGHLAYVPSDELGAILAASEAVEDGSSSYPAQVAIFAPEELNECWRYVASLQHDDEAFNIAWLPNHRIVVFPRLKWIAEDHPANACCPAWSEYLLIFHLTDERTFNDADWDEAILRGIIRPSQHSNPPLPHRQ